MTESAKMLSRLLPEQIEMVTILSPAPAYVMADPDQIHQVLMNLAVNAQDAMPAGGKLAIQVAVRDLGEGDLKGRSGRVPGVYVLVSVADTGIGMDEQARSHIFEPFFTTKMPGEGTGLGLATVYGVIKQSLGWIEVESALGEGSTFEIYLPRIEPPFQAGAKVEAGITPTRGSDTVLVTEDQSEVRAFAQRVLESQGYRVLVASSAVEALAIGERHPEPIHLLLTDIVMPGMNGRELAKQLAVLRPGIRVIFTSGYANELIAQHNLLDPGLVYISKPFSAEMLAATVREVLDAPLQPDRKKTDVSDAGNPGRPD